jgi:hypothetical protein
MNNHSSREDLEQFARGVAGEGCAVGMHAANCAACAAILNEFQDEDDALHAILSPVDVPLDAHLLKRVLAARQVRPVTGWARQAAAAAVILIALMFLLFSPTRGTHRVLEGSITTADGRRFDAPSAFEASPVIALETAKAPATLSLVNGGLMELRPATRVELRELSRVEIESLGGEDMKGIASGVLVTVFAGSLSLSQAHGSADLVMGRSAVLSASRVPLLVGIAQEGKAALAKRLEALALEIGKLEEEVKKLETEHAGLKTELQRGVAGTATTPAGAPGGVPAGAGKEK